MSWGIIILAGAALLAGEPAQTAEKSTDPADKKICRSEQTTGTRLQRKKTCMTRRAWEEAREVNKAAAARNADPTGRAPPATTLPVPR